MKKIRKGKKMLLIILIAIIAIIATIVITNIVKNISSEPEVPIDETAQVIPLPETTYSNMEVKNIQMEYLKNNDQTMVTMKIHNTTEKKVENERLDVVWIDQDEKILGQIETWIQKLDVGEQYEISVILDGDLTATKQVKLIKK